jgi:hypothetical protein
MPVLEVQDTGFKSRWQEDLIIICDGSLASKNSTLFPGPYPALAAGTISSTGSINFNAIPVQYVQQILSGFGMDEPPGSAFIDDLQPGHTVSL